MRGAVLLAVLVGQAAGAETLSSGLSPILEDARMEMRPGDAGPEDWATFRFLAEGMTGYDQVMDDFAVLCAEVALPALAQAGHEADVIVVALTDRPVPLVATASPLPRRTVSQTWRWMRANSVAGTGP